LKELNKKLQSNKNIERINEDLKTPASVPSNPVPLNSDNFYRHKKHLYDITRVKNPFLD